MSHPPTQQDELLESLRPKPKPIDKLAKPFQVFFNHRLAGAGLLMLATVAAVVWANSPWAHSYHHLLETDVVVGFGRFALRKSLHHWINDGLMGVFFFMVGLEIKRELMVGELSSLRKATLPAIAAVGGMAVPALIYASLNATGPAAGGWGIPMATDIAFALGVLALLGDRVPLGLKVFLTALAIVDDIGAVLVIALFYTADLSWLALVAGVAFIGISTLMNVLGVRNPAVYFIVGVLAWLGFLESGVHATVAAILMAFTIPARTRIDGERFLNRMKVLMGELDRVGLPEDNAMNTREQQHLFELMNDNIDMASAPLQRTEEAIAGPVTFLVLPLFALANAGVEVSSGLVAELTNPIVVGIVLGLFFGKTIGVVGASFVAVKLGVADLPKNVGWRQLTGVGMLAGIGFTMALFVANLAFAEAAMVESAKVGVLLASAVSGLLGYLVVRRTT